MEEAPERVLAVNLLIVLTPFYQVHDHVVHDGRRFIGSSSCVVWLAAFCPALHRIRCGGGFRLVSCRSIASVQIVHCTSCVCIVQQNEHAADRPTDIQSITDVDR